MYMAEYEEILDITLILCACRLFTARCRFAFLFYSSSPPSAVNLPTDPRRPGAAICFVHMHSRLFVQHGELSVTIVHFRISAPSWRYEYGVGVQPNRRFGKSERMQVPPDGYNTGLLNHMVWMYTKERIYLSDRRCDGGSSSQRLIRADAIQTLSKPDCIVWDPVKDSFAGARSIISATRVCRMFQDGFIEADQYIFNGCSGSAEMRTKA
jgi:hypothetical protein